MDFFIEVLDFLSRNRFGFLLCAALILVFTKVSSSVFSSNQGISDTNRKTLSRTANILFLVAILTLMFGTDFTNKLIYDHGQIGEGLVVDIYETGDMYNEEPVVQYDAMIKTQTGETVETSFKNTDFNLYPDPEGKYSYPAQGVPFTVKHITNSPKTFVIVTDDNSAYAAGKSCAEKLNKLNTAKSQHDFAPNNPSYKENYRKAIELYLDSECTENVSLLNFYTQEMQKLE